MVLAEMSLVILGRWPEHVAALLPEAPPEQVHEHPSPHKG
jgi:hypothetical protein